VLVDQRAQGLALDVGQVLLGRLDTRRDHQQAHPLDDVVARDDVVVDRRHHPFDQPLRLDGYRGGLGRRRRLGDEAPGGDEENKGGHRDSQAAQAYGIDGHQFLGKIGGGAPVA
jgi:hypothetical protein